MNRSLRLGIAVPLIATLAAELLAAASALPPAGSRPSRATPSASALATAPIENLISHAVVRSRSPDGQTWLMDTLRGDTPPPRSRVFFIQNGELLGRATS